MLEILETSFKAMSYLEFVGGFSLQTWYIIKLTLVHGYKEYGDQRHLNMIKIGDLPIQETCAKSSPNNERDLAEVLVFKALWETCAC